MIQGCLDRGTGKLAVAPQLAKHLSRRRTRVADRLGHRGRQTPGEFQVEARTMVYRMTFGFQLRVMP
jgi:hypothetical protein